MICLKKGLWQVTQKPPASVWKDRSKALGVAAGPVYHRKDFRLHSSLSPREGNTSSLLEQDVTLPSSSRFLSGMNSLSCCLHWARSLFWGQLGALSYLYHLGPSCPPLKITFMGSFYNAFLDRTGQSRAVPSEYPSQQACLSAEPELLKRWTSQLLSLTSLWLHAVWQGLHCSAETKQPEVLKVRTSL